jgi:hypothetical protein
VGESIKPRQRISLFKPLVIVAPSGVEISLCPVTPIIKGKHLDRQYSLGSIPVVFLCVSSTTILLNNLNHPCGLFLINIK